MQSKELSALINQIHATGIQKLDGYTTNMLEMIPENERQEAEKIILDAFVAGDSQIAVLVNKMRYKDGIKILLAQLDECKIPSGRSVEIALVLGQSNPTSKIYDVLLRNYLEREDSRMEISQGLLNFKPSYELFCFYERILELSTKSTELTSIVNGILYCCGLLKDPNDMMECIKVLDINKEITTCDNELRNKKILELREKYFSRNASRRMKEIYTSILKKILNGVKIAHSTSRPVLYQENGKYYLAVFVFFYTKEDIEAGAVDRPTVWAIADVETGEIIEERQTKKIDFSDASYDVKYNVRSDAQYDTSKKYYDDAFAILDSVREKIVSTGKLYNLEYKYYLDKILANIPKDYQRFYTDLSV